MIDFVGGRWRQILMVGALLLVAGGVQAQGGAAGVPAYPVKPIHLIVPFPPGGAVDILGRLVGARVADQIGQPVIIENRSGANGNIGTEYAAKAAPDGYTVLFTGNGLATNNALYRNLGYDVARDFAAVAYLGYAPLVMVVPADFPARSLGDIIALAKADPKAVSYASAGSGSTAHLGSELLKAATGTQMLHVPYKGGAPAITDLVGGRVSFMLLDPPQSLPQIKAGRLRAIAVGSRERLSLLPDVPTLEEGGLQGLETTVWWGFAVPKATPRDIVTLLNLHINRALEDTAVRARLTEMGVTTRPQTADQFAAYVTAEGKRWSDVITRFSIKPD